MIESGKIKTLLYPKYFLPILLAVSLLAFAFGISDIGQVWHYIRAISWSAAGKCLWLAVCYLAFKSLQFRFLLGEVGINLNWRRLILAFTVGEMMQQVPAGVYAENYILKYVRGDRYSVTTAATTSSVLIELGIALVVLLLIGIPGWIWVRPVAAGLIAGIILFFTLLLRSGRLRHLSAVERSGWSGKFIRGFGRLDSHMHMVFTSPNFAVAVVLGFCYMGFLMAGFYTISAGIGLDDFNILRALTIYLFAQSISILVGGVLPQLGTAELAGQGAARAWGYTVTQGLAIMIGFRLFWTASVWIICGPLFFLLRKELRERQ